MKNRSHTITTTIDLKGDENGVIVSVGGKMVDETKMPKMHISTYSLAETFDVGRDTGTQVSKLYDGPFPFKGGLNRVVIELTD